jgi:hypothetical protein
VIRALALLLIACDGVMPLADAGMIDAGTAVAEPELPSFGPCVDGATARTTDDGVVFCEAPAITACPEGEAWFRTGCRAIGGECPSDLFPGDLPDGTRYVRIGSDGDGTRASPFGSIARAMDGAPPGTTIALAAGSYDELVEMRSGVTLRGACARETILGLSTLRGRGVIELSGVEGAVLRDVTIGPSDNIGLSIREGSELSVEGVLVDGAMLIGVAVLEGSSLTARQLVVRGTRAAGALGLGHGVAVEASSAELTDLVLERNNEMGLAVRGNRSEVNVEGFTSIDPVAAGDPPVAIAVSVTAGTLAVRGALLEGSTAAAVLVLGGAVDLEDAEIRRVSAPTPDRVGWGVGVNQASVRAQRLTIHGATGQAIAALGDASIDLTDVLVRETQGERAQATVERMAIYGSTGVAILVSGNEDLEGPRASIVGSSITVVDVAPLTTGGTGLYFQHAAHGELERVRIERASELAIGLVAGADASLRDLIVLDTVANATSGEFGRGLEVLGGSVSIERARFERQREASILIASGTLDARDLWVIDTLERGCAETTCRNAPGGVGVGASRGSRVTLERFTIDGARLCGVQVHGDGELDLHDGTITRAAVGACVQVAGYDLARLTDDVAYDDNGVAVQATSYEPPESRDVLVDP